MVNGGRRLVVALITFGASNAAAAAASPKRTVNALPPA
jgi:hypothetical protein